MLAKCANPSCSNLFLYLHQGKLFRLDTSTEPGAHAQFREHPQHVEFFWLCDECSASMTVTFRKDRGVEVQPFAAMPPGASSGLKPVRDANTSRLPHSSESVASRPASAFHRAAG